jgi:hypothetical protein
MFFLSTEKQIIKGNLTAKPRIPLRNANVNYETGFRITWEEGERGQVGGGEGQITRCEVCAIIL